MRYRRFLWRAARLALTAQLCLVARGARAAPTEIVYWSWNDDSRFVEKFNQTHPDIKVKFEKVPSSNYEAKLLAAVKAGAGPDVMMEQYQFLPTVLVGGAVADLVPLGATAVKSRYPQWLWNQVQFGPGVYAVPLDIGPLALVYRADVFEKLGVQVPRTWAEFAQAAEKIKAAEPDLYITMFATNEPAWFAAVASQGGARWFRMAGDAWQVTIDDATTRKVAAYWQDLVARKLVLAEPIWTDAWYSQLSAMAGYALAHFRFAGRDAVFAAILGAILVPGTALVLPLYLLMNAFGLVNTVWAVLLPSAVSPFGVYLSRIYAASNVPRDLVEAARIEGAGEGQIFRWVVFPLLSPALVTVFLFQFVAIWNNYFLALVMLSDQHLYPVTLGLQAWSVAPSNSTTEVFDVGRIILGASLSILPTLAGFLLLQRHWRSGLTMGAVKA